MESTHISAHVDSCGRSFLSLRDALQQTPRFAAQIRPEAINDEFDRFKLWSGNIAAHRRGRRSLEYRLRDAAHLKDETQHLLTDLQDSLKGALSIVNGDRRPWDEFSESESDSGSSSASSADDEQLQGNTELKQLYASSKNTVTCLFRLAMAIRDPAPNSQHRSTITVDKSFFEQHDIHHVEAKFAGQGFLMNRLGRAISGRRQYLTYREEHHKKLSKNVEKIGFEEPRTEKTSNSTEATPMPPPLLAGDATAKPEAPVLHDNDDVLSQTSYATSVNATIRTPSLPKEAKDQEFYECPLCFMIVSIHTQAAWKQHVYRDLHPYCCTFEHCTTADRLYDSRHAWFTHELEAHRISWQCIEDCGESFNAEHDFETHVSACHKELASDDMLSALKRTSARSADLMERTACSLCGKVMTLRALQKHLGQHQEQLALFALPPDLDATEDEPQGDEDAGSTELNIDNWEHEEIASETSEDGDPSTSENVVRSTMLCRNCEKECDTQDSALLDCLSCETRCHVSCLNEQSQFPYSGEVCTKCIRYLEKHLEEQKSKAGIALPERDYRKCARCKETYSFGPRTYFMPRDIVGVLQLYRRHRDSARVDAQEWEKKHVDCSIREPSENSHVVDEHLAGDLEEETAGSEQDMDEDDMDSVRDAWKSVKAQRESKEEEKMLEQARQRMEEEERENRLREEEFKAAQDQLLQSAGRIDTEPLLPGPATSEEILGRLKILQKKYQSDFEERCNSFITNSSPDIRERKDTYYMLVGGLQTQIISKMEAVDVLGDPHLEVVRHDMIDSIQGVISNMDLAVEWWTEPQSMAPGEGTQTTMGLDSDKTADDKSRSMRHETFTTDTKPLEPLMEPSPGKLPESLDGTYPKEHLDPNVNRDDIILEALTRMEHLYPGGRKEILFRDAAGRTFNLPWDVCKSSKGMEEMIKQVYLTDPEAVVRHVHEGHYDLLVGPDREIVLPKDWERKIQPHSTVTMRMWPELKLPERDESMESTSPLAGTEGDKVHSGLAAHQRIAKLVYQIQNDKDLLQEVAKGEAPETKKKDYGMQSTRVQELMAEEELIDAEEHALEQQNEQINREAVAVAVGVEPKAHADATEAMGATGESSPPSFTAPWVEQTKAARNNLVPSERLAQLDELDQSQNVEQFEQEKAKGLAEVERLLNAHDEIFAGDMELAEAYGVVDSTDRVQLRRPPFGEQNKGKQKVAQDELPGTVEAPDDDKKGSFELGGHSRGEYSSETFLKEDDTGGTIPREAMTKQLDIVGANFQKSLELEAATAPVQRMRGDQEAFPSQQHAPAEATMTKDTGESNIAHAKALAEAKTAAEEMEQAKKVAEEEAATLVPSYHGPEPPIKFQDALGRRFQFSWSLGKSWKTMESLIKQAFKHIEGFWPHVQEGHYNLVGPDGEIILPQTWETVIQPGWAVTMHMWPMTEVKSPELQSDSPPEPHALTAPPYNEHSVANQEYPMAEASHPRGSDESRGTDLNQEQLSQLTREFETNEKGMIEAMMQQSNQLFRPPSQISEQAVDPATYQEKDQYDSDSEMTRSMARKKFRGDIDRAVMHVCGDCGKEFKRQDDCTKHEKTHSRPWKCSEETCKYYDLGWPTEKERDRHVNDKHSATPHLYKCPYWPCEYASKRESNYKQHRKVFHGVTDYESSESKDAAIAEKQEEELHGLKRVEKGIPKEEWAYFSKRQKAEIEIEDWGEKEEEEVERFLAKEKAEEDEKRTRNAKQDAELEDAIRERLAHFESQEDRIQTVIRAEAPFRRSIQIVGDDIIRHYGPRQNEASEADPEDPSPTPRQTVHTQPQSPTVSTNTEESSRPQTQELLQAKEMDSESLNTTPGMNDSPYISFAIDQLARDEEVRGSKLYPTLDED